MAYYDEVVGVLKKLTGAKTIRELSQKLEVNPKNFNTWKTRGEIPEKTLAILAYRIGVSLDKLIGAVSDGDDSVYEQSDSIDTDHLYFIRKTTSVKASAGGGNELEGVRSYQTGELMPIAKAFFKVPPGKNLGSMEVEGESMTPMLRSGDWVIFREDGAFAGDGLYVVNFSDQLMVKILQLTPRGMLKIVSVNPNFQSYEISLGETQEHFKIVGKVVKSIV